jgi:sortase A
MHIDCSLMGFPSPVIRINTWPFKHGFEVFRDAAKGNCASCHTVGKQYALFTDLRFHNVGSSVKLKGEIEDKGRHGVTKLESDVGSFKTPSLRNVALTSPYFHQGEHPEAAARAERRLEALVTFHTNVGCENPEFHPDSIPATAKRVVEVSAASLESSEPTESASTHSLTTEPSQAMIQIFDEDLVGRLEIPRLGTSVMVFAGTQAGTLLKGVGLVENTAWPGEKGNVGIAGHRDTSFRALRNISQGDSIILSTVAGRFVYQVEWKAVVDPLYTKVLAPTLEPSLTLVTCFPFEYVGPAPRRFIVRAVAVSPVVTSSTEPAKVLQAETASPVQDSL